MDFGAIRERAEKWLEADPDPVTAGEIRGLMEREDRAALVERFAAPLQFGTAGLRGIIGGGLNRMNRAVVRRTTAGLARYLKEKIPSSREMGVVVGRDARQMSLEFAEDGARVLAAEGIRVWVFPEVVPTPVTSFGVTHLGAAAGIMITASHNPPEYNGYKVYWENGAQIIPPHDRGIAVAIESIIDAKAIRLADLSESRNCGLWREIGPEVGKAYREAVLKLRCHPKIRPGLKIVYSALHGVGATWVEQVFREANFAPPYSVAAQHEPDGRFPTVRFPNPEEPGALDLSLALAKDVNADLILANDPDADRLAVVIRNSEGALQPLSGNEVGVLMGHYLLTQSPVQREKPLVITTIVSSGQLKRMAQDLGALYDETLTGFKWIANCAMERAATEGAQFIFGYEEALGYCVGTVTRDKDGISAALIFAELAGWCQSRGVTVQAYLEEIQRRYGVFASKQRSLTFPGAAGAQTISRIMDGFRSKPPATIGANEVERVLDYLSSHSSNVLAFALKSGSRVTLRPSGTEPKIKFYFEHREPTIDDEAISYTRDRANRYLADLEKAFLAIAEQFE